MHKARTIYPSKTIQNLLLKVRPETYRKSTLVSPSPRTSSYINNNNLSIQRAGIPPDHGLARATG